jgi:hypothetical protein
MCTKLFIIFIFRSTDVTSKHIQYWAVVGRRLKLQAHLLLSNSCRSLKIELMLLNTLLHSSRIWRSVLVCIVDRSNLRDQLVLASLLNNYDTLQHVNINNVLSQTGPVSTNLQLSSTTFAFITLKRSLRTRSHDGLACVVSARKHL